MRIQESLDKIRTEWVERISHDLARGEGVRAGFTEQLERFYEMLGQSAATGDPAWLDSILYDWGRASTETNLEKGDYDVAFLLNRMIALTIEVVREQLGSKDAVEALAVIVPILSNSLSVVMRYEMEARVAHISSELGQVQEKLQELDRRKSNFISLAAHELKTPLTLIEGYTSMLTDNVRRSPQDPIMAEMLKGIETGTGRLRQIVDDMIDVSLLENNLLELNFQPVTVSHLVKLLKNELEGLIAERGQTLVIREFEDRSPVIRGDAARLHQALLNVATNAIKYTPDDGTITVGGRLLPGFVEITITDTGIGIPVEHQALIFEKFGQLGRSDLHSSGKTKFKGGGPGLGLPIARGILEAHGGSIWVESQGYDEVKLPGSAFHILLPLEGGQPEPGFTKPAEAPDRLMKDK